MSDTAVVIQIGNSDDKLSQSMWAHYVHAVRQCISACGIEIHFSGTSDGDAPWQNACWVVSVLEPDMEDFQKRLIVVKNAFRQDSIAVIIGDVRMW